MTKIVGYSTTIIYPMGVCEKVGGHSRMNKIEEGCTCHDIKHREEKEYGDLIHRLNRIEGQVRGVKSMVEEERYCVDIINQVMAITSALRGFNRVLLSNHIKSCVVEDIKAGDEQVVEELCATISKLMK